MGTGWIRDGYGVDTGGYGGIRCGYGWERGGDRVDTGGIRGVAGGCRGGEGCAVDRKLPIPGWSDADRSVVRRLV